MRSATRTWKLSVRSTTSLCKRSAVERQILCCWTTLVRRVITRLWEGPDTFVSETMLNKQKAKLCWERRSSPPECCHPKVRGKHCQKHDRKHVDAMFLYRARHNYYQAMFCQNASKREHVSDISEQITTFSGKDNADERNPRIFPISLVKRECESCLCKKLLCLQGSSCETLQVRFLATFAADKEEGNTTTTTKGKCVGRWSLLCLYALLTSPASLTNWSRRVMNYEKLAFFDLLVRMNVERTYWAKLKTKSRIEGPRIRTMTGSGSVYSNKSAA